MVLELISSVGEIAEAAIGFAGRRKQHDFVVVSDNRCHIYGFPHVVGFEYFYFGVIKSLVQTFAVADAHDGLDMVDGFRH